MLPARIAREKPGQPFAHERRRQLARLESAWRQQIYPHLHGSAIEGQISAVEASWQQHVPAFLNAVSSVAGFGYELSRTKKQLLELSNSFRSQTGSTGEIQNAILETARQLPDEVKKIQDKFGKVEKQIESI